MKLYKKVFSTFLIMLCVWNFYGFSNEDNTFTDITEVKDFYLKNVDGKYFSLNSFPEAKGFIVIFTCNQCPFAKLYTGRMNDLNSKYKDSGIPLIAINSTDTLLFDENNYSSCVKFAKERNFNFPYLSDPSQLTAKDFGAQKTPHAFIIWKENNAWVIKYSGGIDDNAAEPEKVTNHYLADAVDELLSGKNVTNTETKSIGCKIIYR